VGSSGPYSETAAIAVPSDAAVVDARAFDGDLSDRGLEVSFALVAVAHHESSAFFVDEVRELFEVLGDLRVQRGNQHRPCAFAKDLGERISNLRPWNRRDVVSRLGHVAYPLCSLW